MVVLRRFTATAVVLVLSLAGALAAASDPALDCASDDNDLRIIGCSKLLERPGLSVEQRSNAYGLRALAYSLKGQFEIALADYGAAIRLKPDFAVALNNRAWAYFKLGRASEGAGDVERALEIAPGSPYAFDTRAHIRQALGDPSAALSDYELAIRYGGGRIVRLYQCGLRSQGLYGGRIDGVYSPTVKRALKICVSSRGCDPLPVDEDCKPAVS